MVELRTNTDQVLKALRQGVRLLLTYRGKELAEITPIRKKSGKSQIDPLLQVAERAVPSPMGALDHDRLDQDIYH